MRTIAKDMTSVIRCSWMKVARSDRSGCTIKRNIGFIGQLIDEIENFEFLGFVVQRNAEDVGGYD